MKKINFFNIRITDGFWKLKQDMVKKSTVAAVYNRFKQTHRFDAFRCTWKPGQADMPHIFWDSDVAKWIEGVSYILKEERNEELEKIIDDVVEQIAKNSDENGYFNSHFLVTRQNERFQHRHDHELYCAGHLIEGAVAYADATGKDDFLNVMCKYTDYIYKVFVEEKKAKFVTPGHPELELALVKLYNATKNEKYLKLAEFFIDEHGRNYEDRGFREQEFNTLYNQDEMKIKDRSTAEGHAVRAMYLMCGAADIAEARDDKELLDACKRVFDNAVNKRMYITGGIGSTHFGEAFTVDYDLPNRTAYAETCASISLAMFAGRMQALEVNSKYADIVEKTIYNGILSGVSMDGKSFFYENPLEIDTEFNNPDVSVTYGRRFPITQRKEVFDCSCCPPNIVRFIPSIAQYMYTYDDEILYVHQYINSNAECDGMQISQKTGYPKYGTVKIKCDIGNRKIALRIPSWCKKFKLNCEYELKNGYAVVKPNAEIILELDMTPRAVRSNRKVHANAGRVAIMRGPVVYCAEGVDNGSDLKNVRVDIHSDFSEVESEFILPSLKTTAYIERESEELYLPADDTEEKIDLTLIPYYAFANRGTSDMLVWFLKN